MAWLRFLSLCLLISKISAFDVIPNPSNPPHNNCHWMSSYSLHKAVAAFVIGVKPFPLTHLQLQLSLICNVLGWFLGLHQTLHFQIQPNFFLRPEISMLKLKNGVAWFWCCWREPGVLWPFECSADNSSWYDCASPVGFSGLLDGLHSFSVRVPGGTASSLSWTIGVMLPLPLSLHLSLINLSFASLHERVFHQPHPPWSLTDWSNQSIVFSM